MSIQLLYGIILWTFTFLMVSGGPSSPFLGQNNGMFSDVSMNCVGLYPDGNVVTGICKDMEGPFLCYKKKPVTIQVTGCGTVDKDYHLDSRTGHCYKFHTQGRTWPVAYLTCAAEGGYLAIINNEVEADVLRQLFANYPTPTIDAQYKDVANIGVLDLYSNRVWKTIDGQGLTEAGYEQWAPGEPNNDSNNQYCGGIYRSGRLDDTYCDRTFPFVCEKDPRIG